MCDGICNSLSLFILRFTFVKHFKQQKNDNNNNNNNKWEDIEAQVYAFLKINKTID